jgi:hypothetical protein
MTDEMGQWDSCGSTSDIWKKFDVYFPLIVGLAAEHI